MGLARRTGLIWEALIITDLKYVEFDGVEWIHVAQDRDQWWVLMYSEMNHGHDTRSGTSSADKRLLVSQEGLCCMESVTMNLTVRL
jgi:hypothetical protein